MDVFIQQLVNGLTLGAMYALVALGYTMVYGIIGLINFAHGEVVMIGAMVCFSVIGALMGLPLPKPLIIALALLAAVAVCMVLAYAMERMAYRPLRNAPRLTPLITAIGLSLVLQQVAILIWSRNYLTVPGFFKSTSYEFGGVTVTDYQIIILLITALLMSGLLLLVHKTKLGIAMRATAQRPNIARLMGINVNTTIAAAFVIGAALAAAAGLMNMAYYGVIHYYMGFLLGLKAFTAAVLGGIGNIAGAMLGGLLLGVIEALGAGYIGDLTGGVFGSNYQDVFAFFILILVLIFRPSGLLGERVGDRA